MIAIFFAAMIGGAVGGFVGYAVALWLSDDEEHE